VCPSPQPEQARLVLFGLTVVLAGCTASASLPSVAPVRALQASSTSSPVAAYPTTISASRFWIDANNLTFSFSSDEDLASVGAADDFGDGLGSLKATAVLILTGTDASSPYNPMQYVPLRCDFLLYRKPFQTRVGITDFQLTLFSDDGTSTHNPDQQVRVRKGCAR
jgi:hypothetical protein